jgi:transcription elongation factor GreA
MAPYMADVTLEEAVSRFLETVKEPKRAAARADLQRFIGWYNRPEHQISQLRAHDIATYGETLGPANPDSRRRADSVRAFLDYLKAEGLMETSLKSHLRLRKAARGSGQAASSASAPSSVELTADGVDALKTELEGLIEERIGVREDIRKAMLDKDFRENSPLDAAKDKQGHLEARIREIEAMLKRAVVVDTGAQTGRVRVGCTVRVTNLGNGKTTEYNIVGPTEANAANSKISSSSPVGKALLDCAPGDEVEVSVPAGTMRLKVEDVQG